MDTHGTTTCIIDANKYVIAVKLLHSFDWLLVVNASDMATANTSAGDIT